MQRHSINVRGVVQGVGFRPFVYELAIRHGLAGFVRNLSGSVVIEVEGSSDALARFRSQLESQAPPAARIDAIDQQALPACGDVGFRIELSEPQSGDQVFVAADLATCASCLAELFDPQDRRYRYPFLNCTDCGPRLTIVEGTPYDRHRTTMAKFTLCPACLAEYQDPTDRRFHAQATACPECGPRLMAQWPDGEPVAADQPLSVFVDLLLGGGIGALQGLGGFHLVCRAQDDSAVQLLRARKHRDQKPFAVMVLDVAAVQQWCYVDSQERALLESPQRPIVLLRKRQMATVGGIADSVAPGNPNLGVILPYTPLHYLLMDAVRGAPLVMTSGNRSDEPIARTTDEAVCCLGDIADLLLTHNRPIRVRCDDSVTRIVAGEELPLRRSRGYAPLPIKLPVVGDRPTLAVGGQLKSTFALAASGQAILSHHVGDLDHLAAYRAFNEEIALYERLFGVDPALVVHDEHPDYASTAYALRRSGEANVMRLATQHHHAHMASCMAEHGLDEPMIGVIFDGTGYGRDAAVWGGEFLVGDYQHFSRYTHLRYVRLPGAAKAIDEPWRMAVAHLTDAGCDPRWLTRHPRMANITSAQFDTVEQMIERGVNAPWTSSAGRLFDAVAAILGLAARVSYEGQAAMDCEWQASDQDADGVYPFQVDQTVDTRPLIRAIVSDLDQGTCCRLVARRFHSTMVAIVVAVCERIRHEQGLDGVVLSGGVFQNAILLHETVQELKLKGFRVYRHRLVPPNDGGLCLGQLAIAAKRTSLD